IVFIYLVAVGSWFVFMCMHLITITDLSVLTYPYLLEHILFAVGMKWTLDILAPQPARSNYDLL
ncbi:MAG: hypothetical protein JST76_00810, partial [Bacteroidetes bacterium]|nr:hypothetical protein [Bacteroidota bacterium]